MHNKIGILGGLGPFATSSFLQKFLEIFKEIRNPKKDQDFPEIVVEIASKTPDRTAFILEKFKENPVPNLVKALKSLENCGCNIITMPCNTAHFFINQLENAKNESTRIVNLIEETAIFCQKNNYTKPLLLATKGTILSKIYHKYFDKLDINLQMPKAENIKELMEIIYGENGVKAGFANEKNATKLAKIVGNYTDEDVIILGCTELPLIAGMIKKNKIDPMEIVCRKIIQDLL